jgi:hypothetical protein
LTNPAAPQSPFVISAYNPPGYARAGQLESQADQNFSDAEKANRISDAFTQGTVFLAMALFFGGIGQVFGVRRVRLALLIVAIVSCAVGVGRILTLPILSPG